MNGSEDPYFEHWERGGVGITYDTFILTPYTAKADSQS